MSLTTPRILIVDDQISNIRLLTEILEDLAEIFFVTVAKEAFERALELQPDLVLLDIEMPDITGFAVCQQLKNHPLTSEMSVIFISAHTEAEFEFNSLAQGAIDFIGRPFNRAICRLRVQNHLTLQQQAKALQRKSYQLHDEKQRLQITLNAIGDAVIATDTAGLITLMNPIAERMTGWREKEALGKPITDVMNLVDADSQQSVTNPIFIALTEKRIVAMALNCQLIPAGSPEGMAVEDSAAPIFDHTGNLLGAIIVFHDVSQARALALKMSFLANHDQLTGLPNRILLYDRIHQACRLATVVGRQVGIVLIDIDQFKYLNDSLGHQIGDQLLLQLSKRLQDVLQPEDTLARIGGDEFVLVLPDVSHVEQISNLTQSILRLARKPFRIDDDKYTLTVSMGISVYPTDAANEEELMRHADVALFKAKQEGRNGFCFFSDELGRRMVQRHQYEQKLRAALTENRVEVHYQPKVRLLDGVVVGAEALVRIRLEDGSLLMPGDFITLAEETGLVIPLGKQVLIQSCHHARTLQNAGYCLPVSVNIAASQFTDASLLGLIEQLVAEHQLPPHLLELEVTETALIQDPQRTASVLDSCRQLGLTVAIDDFGTGYSSLAYLKRFKVDTLKIDMSFVKEMLTDKSDYEIVKTIVSLGRSMNYQLVAEGVETAEHVRQLLALGCPLGQGYYYSKPLPKDAFIEYVRQHHATLK
ncbi:EAL domain-containing protein [Rheinheimera sp. FR7-31]|uniref:putative bifunctional diguanylate cyclase/phosphodiesterase n=1 Tax=Rheinheimera fenheensis TaxID=3152295 RepID=UPI00325DEC21